MTRALSEPAAISGASMLRLPFLALSLFAIGCCKSSATPAAPAPPPAASRPPPPAPVAKESPSNEGPDVVKDALERLLTAPIEARRRDRWGTLRVPLADWKNWRRIRIFGHPTRATFQYGDKYTALLTVRYSPSDGPDDPEHCLAGFMKYASPIATSYGIRLGESQLLKLSQSVQGQPRPILVRLQEGGVDSIVTSDDYVGFMAAYQSWPGTCLVQGFAVVATDHPALAAKVRDRWVAEAVARLTWEKKVKEAPDPSLMK